MRLCLEYKKQETPHGTLTLDVDGILAKVGCRFRLSTEWEDGSARLLAPISMTPSIISDLAARDLAQPWDTIAIVANCCQYLD